ncbi:unnamed protein product, partial [Cylindrotheca closterium]
AAAAGDDDDDDHTGAGDVDGDVDDGFLHYDPDPNATTVAISLWQRRRANTGAGVSRAQDVKLLGHKNESLPMVTVKMNQILETWAKKVAHKLQSVAHIKCRYPLPLEYAGDITPPIIQVLSYYLTVQDVLEALEQRIFPGMTLANILEQQDMTVYFDNESLALARSHVATGRGGAAATGFYEPDVAQNYFD